MGIGRHVTASGDHVTAPVVDWSGIGGGGRWTILFIDSTGRDGIREENQSDADNEENRTSCCNKLMRCFSSATKPPPQKVLRNTPQNTIISHPQASIRLDVGDWVYVTLGVESGEAVKAMETAVRCLDTNKEGEGGVECIVDFDAFHFPAHCVGKTIKEAGMRTQFGFGLALIGEYNNSDESADASNRILHVWDPNPQFTIGSEHYGLCCRVPCRSTGFSFPSLTEDVLGPFLDEASYDERMARKNKPK